MIKYHRYLPLYTIFSLLVFITSCNGQDKTILPKNNGSNPTTAALPKLIRTQGTNQASAVSCGLQDKAGNLWFGSSGEGIYIYDGKSFTNLLEKNGLCNNNIQALLEDKNGKIWIGTSTGLCQYDPTSGNITSIPILVNDDDDSASSTGKTIANTPPEIWSMMQDKTGKIWFGTREHGLFCYDGTQFTHFLHNDGVINKNDLHLYAITAIIQDRNGNIWFTTWFEGLCYFDGTAVTNYKPNGEVWFASLLEDKNGNIWVGSRGHGAYRYDPSSAPQSEQPITSMLLPVGGTSSSTSKSDGPNFVNFFANTAIFNACGVDVIEEDKAGNIWFGTEFGNIAKREDFGGLWCYNPSAALADPKRMTNFTMKDGLRNNSVFSVMLDKSGKIWVGTRDMGLNSYDPSVQDSKSSENAFTDFSDKGSKDIRQIFEDQSGKLWFGTNGDGVCRYDPSDSKPTTYFSTKEGLGGTDIRCITADKTGNLWFGTNGGVSKFDGKTFTNFTVKEGLSSNDVWSMLIDKAGTIWVGTPEGVCRYQPSAALAGSMAFTAFSIPAAEENDFSRPISGTKLIWDIKEDRAGNIWFATNGRGVFCYDGKSLTNISKVDGLCNNFVNSILEDKKGNLWFATQHGGVSRYDPSATTKGTKAFTTFTAKDGLCGEEIWKIFEDKAGNIWFSANTPRYPAIQSGSACCYDGRKFTSFKDNDGILSKNYVQSILEDKKGVLWIGTAGGLCRLDPSKGELINMTKEWSLGVL